MSYLHTNQNDFAHIPYPSKALPKATVKSGGCGACAGLMIVENLTEHRYKMADWIKWVISTGARVNGGTAMGTLSKALAKKYNFVLSHTSSEATLKEHLLGGGMAIAHVGGDYNGWKGLFSTDGHYVTIVDYDESCDAFVVLDPAWTKSKFKKGSSSLYTWRSKHIVKEVGTAVYVTATNLNADTKKNAPSYYLFSLTAEKETVEEDMDLKEFEKLYSDMAAEWADNDSGEWSAEARGWAIDNKMISGVGKTEEGATNYAWEKPVTREELIVFLYRLTHSK